MEITQTNLRYLLAVYELMGSNAGVAAVEVSRRMGVSKPSVTRMLGVLAKRGLLVKEPYGKVRLTERGALLAQEYEMCIRDRGTLHLGASTCFPKISLQPLDSPCHVWYSLTEFEVRFN